MSTIFVWREGFKGNRRFPCLCDRNQLIIMCTMLFTHFQDAFLGCFHVILVTHTKLSSVVIPLATRYPPDVKLFLFSSFYFVTFDQKQPRMQCLWFCPRRPYQSYQPLLDEYRTKNSRKNTKVYLHHSNQQPRMGLDAAKIGITTTIRHLSHQPRNTM